MNKPTNKPLTYNRFRAYLRIRLKNKSFSKTRVFLIIAFYILCSLTLFLLPHNVPTQYPYLKYFTDFMDFIPAIKPMEIKTYAPEMCKLYASYMFVVGVVCLGYLSREIIILLLVGILRPNEKHKEFKKKAKQKFLTKPKSYLFCLLVFNLGCFWYIYNFFSGDFVGYLRMRNRDEYFIYNSFEMWYYAMKEIGFMFVVGTFSITVGNIIYFDIFKHNWSKIQWRTKKKT